jgi:uncharacterized protein with GYD domain
MATYICLINFTDQGIRNVKDTTRRAAAVTDMVGKFGVTAREFLWTLGQCDLVGIFDAPDDAAMAAVGVTIGAAGNVRTQMMRAFSQAEMDAVLATAKLG